MKAKLSSVLTAAILASITTSAFAAPQKIRVPAPPPMVKLAPLPVAQPVTAAPAAAPGLVQITPAATHLSRSSKAQRFVQDISLTPTQEKLALKLRVNNGDQTAPSFAWFRMRVNGELLITNQSLKGKREATIDVSGAIPAGQNQIVIDAAGVPGATLTWQIATEAPKVLSIEPKTAQPGGIVVLKGENFAADPNNVNVIVNGSVGDVLKSSLTSMTVRLPEVLTPGKATMSIDANGLPPVMVPLTVSGSAAPVVSGTDMWSAPAGTTITIRGKYFSTNPSANQVFFDNVPGQVTASAADFIKVVVPTLAGVPASQQSSAKVFVVSNGIKSNSSVSFSVGQRSVDKDYRPSVKFGEQATQNSSQASTVSSSGASFSAEQHSSSGAGNQASYGSSSQSGGFSIIQVDGY